MQTLSQLESRAQSNPNSSEISQALADAYAREKRWEEAAKMYRGLAALYPDTAALFINRIRLGAVALMISGTLILIAMLLQPSLDVTAFASAISSPAYFAAQLLTIMALALYSCSAISIYKLLSYTKDHRPAFWAMVFSVVGVGLSMPALGIRSFVFPMLGGMALNGQTEVMEIYFSLNEFPLALYLNLGNYILILGMAIFTWVIWRNRGLSLLAILIFLVGWLGFVNMDAGSSRLLIITFGVLIAVGGVSLGLSLWNQVSAQFDPSMDRSVKA